MQKTLRLFVIFAVFAGLLMQPAYAQIAPGVQQAASQTATITGSVSLSDGTFVGGADVKLIGPVVLSTTSDAHGAFQFTAVPHGIYTVLASAGSLGTASKANVAVSSDINIQVQYAKESTSLRTIANVTTKAAGVHINVTPASIASITPRDYAFSGQTSWQDLLNGVPGVTVNGGSLSGEGGEGIVGNPFAAQIVSINGAIPYETSTTLDGMPFTNSTESSYGTEGSADLSEYSMGAFDSVDIVRGPGANSPSIVNSVGGSLVLHAPIPGGGTHYNLSISNDAWGGISAQGLFQFQIGRKFTGQFTYDDYSSPGPLGRNVGVIAPSYYCPTTINGQPFFGGYGSYPYPNECEGPPNPNDSAYYVGGCNVYQYCYTDTMAFLYCCPTMDTSWIKRAFSGSFQYKVSPNITIQDFYSGSSTSDKGGVAPFYNGEDFQPGPGYTGTQAPGLRYVMQGGYLVFPYNQTAWLNEERATINVAKSGILRLSALQNNSYYSYGADSFYNTHNKPVQWQLWGSGYYCADPSCSSPGALANFNGGTYTITMPELTELFYYWSENRALLASYGMQLGARTSVGASYVMSYLDTPNSAASYTYGGLDYCQFYVGLCAGQDPSVAETTREVRLNAHEDFSDKLALDLSYYFAHADYHVYTCPAFNYFSVCSTYTDFIFPYRAPRLGLTYRFNQNTVARFAAGGGFALPQLSYLTGSSGPPNCSSAQGYCTQSLQNLNLQPEKSFSWDAGMDSRIGQDTMVSFDFYRTNLFGQFYQSYTYETAQQCGSPCGGLPLDIFEYGNLASTRYEGINLSARHDPGSRGVFWNGGLGLTRSYIVSLPAGFYNAAPNITCTNAAWYNCTRTDLIPGVNFTGANTENNGAQPYANGSATIGYRWNPQTYISLDPLYIGPNNPYYRPAFVIFNASAGYGINKHISLIMNFKNLLNTWGGTYNGWGVMTQGAPSAYGPPFGVWGMNYGPRTATLTLNIKG